MTSLQHQILAEQLRSAYKQLPKILTSVVGAGILVYILRDAHPPGPLLTWVSMIVVSCVGAGVLFFFYTRYGQVNPECRNWNVYFIIFALGTGIAWGMIGVLFYSPEVEIKLLLVAWIWAMGAGMASLLIAYKPAFYAMTVPLFLPLAVSLALDRDAFYHGLSIATFLWMASLMYFYQSNHKIFLEAISLRFINAELIEDLTGKKQEAESANLAKSRFLAAASHDLRQPLHAQGLFLAELDQHVDSPKGRRILGGLESSIYAMRKLLTAILDLSRLDAGTIMPHKVDFTVSSILHNLKSEFEILAAEKSIDFRVRESSLSINTDPLLLERILRNLVSNAIRYTSKGKVLVGCRRRAHSVVIHVLDTGDGILDNKQKDIFLPFVQLGNPERDREKGLGLGLSIVQGTCELLGHALVLESTQGRGTAISVDVPRANKILENIQTSNSVTDIRGIEGKCILLVEDDAVIRTAMSGLLKSWGVIPLIFKDADSALRFIRKENGKIDAILSDLNMPGNINGIQLIEKLRGQYQSTIPAALITGETSVNRLREAKDFDCQVIHKPVLACEFRDLVNRLVCQPK